jgi:tetratricopeptide (TPR) repeat protein
MAPRKWIANLAFAVVAALLGLTAVIFSIRSGQTGNRVTEERESSGSQYQENRPIADAADRLRELERLAADNPQNPDFRTQIGNLYYDLGQYDKAADFYQQSLAIRPRDPHVETDLATCFHYMGQSDKALEILDRVLKYNPGFPQAMFNKGVVLVSGKKDVKGGIAVWEDLLKSDPGYPQRSDLEQRIKQLKGSIR